MADTEDTDDGDQRTAGGKAPRGKEQTKRPARGIMSSPMQLAGYLAKSVKGAVTFGSPATSRPAGEATTSHVTEELAIRIEDTQLTRAPATAIEPAAAGAAAANSQELQQALTMRVWPFADLPDIARAWSPNKLQSLLRFLPQSSAASTPLIAPPGVAPLPQLITSSTTVAVVANPMFEAEPLQSSGAVVNGTSGASAPAPYMGLHMLMRGAPGAPLPRSWLQQKQQQDREAGASGVGMPPGLTAGQRARYAPYSSMQRPAVGSSRPSAQPQPQQPQPLPLLSPAPVPASQTSFADALAAANTTPPPSGYGRAGVSAQLTGDQQQPHCRLLGSTAMQTPRTGQQLSRLNQSAFTPANGSLQRVLPSPRTAGVPGSSTLGSALKRARDSPPGSTQAAPLMSSGIKNLAEYKRQRQGYSTPARPLLPRTPRAEAIAAPPPVPVTETARRIMASLDYMSGQAGQGGYNNVAPLSAQPSPAGTPVGNPPMSRLLAGDAGATPPGAYASLAGLAGPAGSTPFPRASAIQQQQYPPTPPTAPPPLERLQVQATPAPAVGRFPELSPAATVAAFLQAARSTGPSASTIIFPPEPEFVKAAETPAASPARAAPAPAPASRPARPSSPPPPAAPAQPAVIPSSPIAFPAPSFGASAVAAATARNTAFNSRSAVAEAAGPSAAGTSEAAVPEYRFGTGNTIAADKEAVRAVASITGRVEMNGYDDVPTFTFGRRAAVQSPAQPSAGVPHDAVEAGRKQLAEAAAIPLPDDDDDENEEPVPAAAAAAPAAAAAADGAFGTVHGSVTPKPTPAAATPVSNGWGDSFLAASKAKLSAASEAAAEEVRKASGKASSAPAEAAAAAPFSPFSQPAAITATITTTTVATTTSTPSTGGGGGWGSALLSANRAQLQAASDAVAKEVDNIKSGGGGTGGTAAAAGGTGGFTPPPAGFFTTPTTGGFSFGQQPSPAPATGGTVSTPTFQFGVPTSTAATPASLLGAWAAGDGGTKDAQEAGTAAKADAAASETVTSVTYGRPGTNNGGIASLGGGATASTAGTPNAALSMSSGHTPGFSFPAAGAPSVSPAFTFGAPNATPAPPQSSAADGTSTPGVDASAPAAQPTSTGFAFGVGLGGWAQPAPASAAATPTASSPMSIFGASGGFGSAIPPAASAAAAAPSPTSWSLPTATAAPGGAASTMFGAPSPAVASAGPVGFGSAVTTAGPGAGGGGFVFGGPAAAPSSSSIPFGSSVTALPFSSTTSGQQQQQQQPAAAFFAAASTPSFGGAAQTSSSSPFGGGGMMFGAGQAAPAPSPIFGGAPAFGGGMQSAAFAPAQQQQQQQQPGSIVFGSSLSPAGSGGFPAAASAFGAAPSFGAGSAPPPAFGSVAFGGAGSPAPVFGGAGSGDGGGGSGGAAFTMGAAQEPAQRARKHVRVKRH